MAQNGEEETDDLTSADDAPKFSSIDTKKLISIAYPGYVKNVDHMLSTMGGEEKISETYYNNKCRLKMTYRPEDKNAHYTCGDLMPCTGLLMRVKRRKKSGHTEGGLKGGYEYKQDIVGVVKEQYKFNTPFDYQYLTPEPLWHHFDEIHGSELAQKDLPPYFAPPVFARIDTVGQYNYRPDPLVRNAVAKRQQGETEDEEPLKEATPHGRKKRQTESMAALFGTEQVPKEPSETAVSIIEKLKLGGDADAIIAIQKMFEERPLWSKLAISCHVDVGFERFKKILQYCGYYWLSGPWRTMWCRIGYDPRKDPSAKIYQMLDFRIRDSKENRDYSRVIPKRSAKNYVPRNLQSRLLSPTSSVMAASEVQDQEREEDSLPYVFSPNKMLPSRNCMYQLCDIEMEEVQRILHENDGQETTCTEKDGWFPPGALQRIRKLMADAVNDLLRENNTSDTGGTNQTENEAQYGDEAMGDQSMKADSRSTSELGFGGGSSYQPYSYLQMLNDTEDLEGYAIYGPQKQS